MRLVPEPPGVELGGHSYCSDISKLLLKTISAFNPPRVSNHESYPRSWIEAMLFSKTKWNENSNT